MDENRATAERHDLRDGLRFVFPDRRPERRGELYYQFLQAEKEESPREKEKSVIAVNGQVVQRCLYDPINF